MASVCRSVATAGSRSVASRAGALNHKTLGPTALPSLFSSSPRSVPSVFRFVSCLATVESLMPLHSAVASARLRSRIAVDSHCWSLLSEGFATPL